MGRRDDGGGGPPAVRERLIQALAGARLTGQPQPLPSLYVQWLTGIRMGIPPWVLEGCPADRPPVEWVVRSFEFTRLEQSVTVTRR